MPTGSEPDPRIVAGATAMMELRADRVRAGAHPIGWKLGFGSPSALERLRIDRPLVGFLTREQSLGSGATVPIGHWTRPLFEAELAVRLGSPVPPTATARQVRSAITGLSLAIELADLDKPPTDIETILAGDIYHRYVIIGAPADRPTDPAGITAQVLQDEAVVAQTSDVEALTGKLTEVLALTAETLAYAGAELSGGDVVILGSFVPPLEPSPGQRLTLEAPGFESVSVTLA